ncbi:unnamed protein product [Ectocarpus sp. 12 AP-2014]
MATNLLSQVWKIHERLRNDAGGMYARGLAASILKAWDIPKHPARLEAASTSYVFLDGCGAATAAAVVFTSSTRPVSSIRRRSATLGWAGQELTTPPQAAGADGDYGRRPGAPRRTPNHELY